MGQAGAGPPQRAKGQPIRRKHRHRAASLRPPACLLALRTRPRSRSAERGEAVTCNSRLDRRPKPKGAQCSVHRAHRPTPGPTVHAKPKKERSRPEPALACIQAEPKGDGLGFRAVLRRAGKRGGGTPQRAPPACQRAAHSMSDGGAHLRTHVPLLLPPPPFLSRRSPPSLVQKDDPHTCWLFQALRHPLNTPGRGPRGGQRSSKQGGGWAAAAPHCTAVSACRRRCPRCRRTRRTHWR